MTAPNRDRAVYADMLNAHVDTYDKSPAYTRNVEAMAIHAVAIKGYVPEVLAAKLLARPTGLTACSEQHYALNRVDYYTARAMQCEMHKQFESAAEFRASAAKWYDYFNDPVRQEKANAEDAERCAYAEHMDLCRLDELHR